jgi:hypothetical protein
MKNLWKEVEPKQVVPGVWAWENCMEVPEGIIDSMNKEVDDWKKKIEEGKRDGSSQFQTAVASGYTGPIRFAPEDDFKEKVNHQYLSQIQSNTMNKVAEYIKIYPDLEEEIGWFESYQYISYKPPKHMKYHSDNHAVRNPDTGFMYVTPYLRRITCLTYLNDNFQGGALDFRYWKDYKPYKPPAGTTVIMPSGFLWSHATTPLLNGRKVAFLVAINSGTNYDAYIQGDDRDFAAIREFM